MGAIEGDYRAAEQASNEFRDHPGLYRRNAYVRFDLGNDRRRPRICYGGYGIDRIQAVCGRILWAFYGRKCNHVYYDRNIGIPIAKIPAQ